VVLGYAVVDFRTPDHLTLFLTAAARGGPRDAFYLRMVHIMAPGAWRTRVGVWDLAISADEAALPPVAADFVLGTGRVYLPSRDIAETTERLHCYLRGHEMPPTSIDWDRVGW